MSLDARSDLGLISILAALDLIDHTALAGALVGEVLGLRRLRFDLRLLAGIGAVAVGRLGSCIATSCAGGGTNLASTAPQTLHIQ